MIRSVRGLILIGVATFIVALLVLFPARAAMQWFLPENVSVSGVDGTLWSGSARAAAVGDIVLSDLEWTLHPLKLLTGQLAASVSGKQDSGFVETDVSLAASGTVSLTNLTASFPLARFGGILGVPGLSGQGNARFERLTITDEIATAADGTLDINNLAVPVVGRDSLGSYSAEFFTQNNGVSASIEDIDGVVDLAGSLQINSDRSFEFLAQVIATPNTPASLRRQLSFLPPANERGQQELRLEGVF